MIKNAVFDFGNVIVNWDINAILEKYSGNDAEMKKLKAVIFESEEWLQLDEGLINAEQAEKIFRDKVPRELKSKVSEIMGTWFEKMEFNQEVCDLIKRLKEKGLHVYGLSNTNIQFYEYMKKSDVGRYFDGFIISAVEKLMKPDEEIFRRLFQKFSLNPAECFFVDDTKENVLAGKKCGMDGFVFGFNKVHELEMKLLIREM